MNPAGTKALRQAWRKKFQSGFRRFSSGYHLSLLLPALALCSAGCASNSAMIIAQRYTQVSLNATDKIALASQSHPRPEEQELRRVLAAELERERFDIVNSTHADYTLAYWLDDSWNAMPTASQPVPIPYLSLAQRTVVYGPGGHVEYYGVPDSPPPPAEIANRNHEQEWTYLLTKGIRLSLYPNHGSVSEKLSPVWEGYIELGLNTSPERESVMVKTLLAHFGQNFKGRARLKK